MVKNQQIQTTPDQQQNPTSKLEAFALSFEYNKTLQEIKRETHKRTHKAA